MRLYLDGSLQAHHTLGQLINSMRNGGKRLCHMVHRLQAGQNTNVSQVCSQADNAALKDRVS